MYINEKQILLLILKLIIHYIHIIKDLIIDSKNKCIFLLKL